MKTFKSILAFQRAFDTDEKCREHLELSRWNGTPVCPFCKSTNVHRHPNGKKFNCKVKGCRKIFSVTVGTIYENSKIGLSKWYLATYILTNHSKGISSLQLAGWLDCTQKTAWFLNHRIREMLTENEPRLLSNVVEADETFIGGKAINKHKSKRNNTKADGSFNPIEDKTPVLGMVERGGKVITKVVTKVNGEDLKLFIRWNVVEGSTLYTDELAAYKRLGKLYTHETVNHGSGEYVRGKAHTNTIEGFWSLLKRQIVGIHHSVSPKHLQRYTNESAFRYNQRGLTQDVKFEQAIGRCEGRLKYEDLIA
ncbi:MAG: family transposase [Bacteroidota bacterium]|nr:family transposase [Bacteroidota bacterium]